MKPISWFSYADAVTIEPEARDRYIRETITYLKAHPLEGSSSIATGDMLITVRRSESGAFYVTDSRVLRTAYIQEKDL